MAKLTVRRSEDMGDWWVIERADHDGRQWLEPTKYGARFMCSARISDADIEGDAEEMHGIADAVEARGSYSAKRCAVRVQGERVLLDSPRNSMEPGVVTLAEADELAAIIRSMVPRPQD